MKQKLLVMIPTYNERENVESIAEKIFGLGIDLDLLFVDDRSTDGTGEVLEKMREANPRIFILHRPGKLGIGSAHVDGIRWAYENGYQDLITMDCDGTHEPKDIPRFLEQAAAGAQVVVGSRFAMKESLADWNFFRKFLTHLGHQMTKWFLKMPYDATGAFRYYDLRTIPRHAFGLVTSKGYSFFFESLMIFSRNDYRISEVPILLPKRTYGHSKMRFADARRSLELLVTTYFKTLFNPEKFEIAEPFRLADGSVVLKDDQGWEQYWENQKTKVGGLLYDAIASFYRKVIIRRSLNYFIQKTFPRGSHVLHAGCGSGQVDVDIRHWVKITGMDISLNALSFYKKTNKDLCQPLYGSIFEIPVADASFDGIYNLGVMEHFDEKEIHKIMKEFHRVLKPGGAAVLFWPPEFGLSVIFFKVLGFFFRTVLRKKSVKFHPDEICRIRSRKHAERMIRAAGFELDRFYFGPKDVFTYAVCVARKPKEVMVTHGSPQDLNQVFTSRSKPIPSIKL